MVTGAPQGASDLTVRRAPASRHLVAVGRTLLRRIVDIVVVLVVSVTAVWVMLQAMPGEPEDVLLKGIFRNHSGRA